MCRAVGRVARGSRVALSRITELVSSVHLALSRISCGRVRLLMPIYFGKVTKLVIYLEFYT